MARKSLADIDPELTIALEEFEDVTFVRWQAAMDTYNAQDTSTQRVIDRITATLETHSTGDATFVDKKVSLDGELLSKYLIYLSIEIVKDLAIMGIRVGNFEFPQSICAMCGSDISQGGADD